MNHVIRRVARLGIADRFHFTVFLAARTCTRCSSCRTSTSCLRSPEPFGISPLEAMRSNVPVIISKQSGVAEVLDYAVRGSTTGMSTRWRAIYALVRYPALAGMFASKGLERGHQPQMERRHSQDQGRLREAAIEENKNNIQ